MATRFSFLIVGLMALAGCQRQAASIQNLPEVSLGDHAVIHDHAAVAVAATMPALPPVAAKPVAAHAQLAAAQDVPKEWIPTVDPRPWRWIVIHHSATAYGNAQIIDGWHREKGWDELGYHFVIGNGTSSGDGQVEVGPRWIKQKWGAHTKTADNRFNDFGIGICLVGNFDVNHPTEKQMQAVAKLVAFLMEKYQISPDRVLGHGEAKPTDCPGQFMSVAEVRRMAGQILVDSGQPPIEDKKVASTDELLKDAGR